MDPNDSKDLQTLLCKVKEKPIFMNCSNLPGTNDGLQSMTFVRGFNNVQRRLVNNVDQQCWVITLSNKNRTVGHFQFEPASGYHRR